MTWTDDDREISCRVMVVDLGFVNERMHHAKVCEEGHHAPRSYYSAKRVDDRCSLSVPELTADESEQG